MPAPTGLAGGALVNILPLQRHLLVTIQPEAETMGVLYRPSKERHVREATVEVVGEDADPQLQAKRVLVNTLMGQWVGDQLVVPEAAILAIYDAG